MHKSGESLDNYWLGITNNNKKHAGFPRICKVLPTIHNRILLDDKTIDGNNQKQSCNNHIGQEQGQIQSFPMNKRLQKSVLRSEIGVHDCTSNGTL